VSDVNLREELYSFLLSGATGDTYGNECVWPFDDAWNDWQGAAALAEDPAIMIMKGTPDASPRTPGIVADQSPLPRQARQ
jgi:hypothetical protein